LSNHKTVLGGFQTKPSSGKRLTQGQSTYTVHQYIRCDADVISTIKMSISFMKCFERIWVKRAITSHQTLWIRAHHVKTSESLRGFKDVFEVTMSLEKQRALSKI